MYSGIHLLLYTFFAVLLFIIGDIHWHLIMAAGVASALFCIPLKKIRGGLVPILMFLGFTFISNLFYQSGKVIAVLGPATMTDEGLRIAAIRTLRVFDLVYAAKILSHITPLETMIGSLRTVLQPMEKIGLPIRDFFSIMTLTLQCFPVLKQRLLERYAGEKQRSAPEDSSQGIKGMISNYRQTAGLIASFVIPLFVESMAEPEKFFTTANLTTDNKNEQKHA